MDRHEHCDHDGHTDHKKSPKQKEVKKKLTNDDLEKMKAQFAVLGLSPDEIDAHLGQFRQYVDNGGDKIKKSGQPVKNDLFEKLSGKAEWKEKIEKAKKDLGSIRGTDVTSNLIVDAIILYYSPKFDADYDTKKPNPDADTSSIMKMIELGTWLVDNKYTDKKITAFYKSVIGNTKVNPDKIDRFTKYCTVEIDKCLRKEEISAIMSQIFKSPNADSTVPHFLDAYEDTAKTLNIRESLLEMSGKLYDLMVGMQTFRNEPKDARQRSYLLALLLLKYDVVCKIIIEAIRQEKKERVDPTLSTKEMALFLLERSNITISEWTIELRRV